MERLKIVFTDYYYADIERERRVLSELDGGEPEIVDLQQSFGGLKRSEELIPHVADADAVVCQFAAMNADVIHSMARCRVIARYAIGVDTIDVVAARARKIFVANVPDYCIEEVSDTALAHILNGVRRLSFAAASQKEGTWDYGTLSRVRRFSRMTVGLVSFGAIARRLAEKLRPFGVRILAYDPYFERQTEWPWIEFAPFEEVLREANVVSIHSPQTAETRHMMDRTAFSAMKPGSILVNTARGGVVDEEALIEALDDGRVALAGLDVLDCADGAYAASPLASYGKRVLVTPHTAWASADALASLQEKTALNVLATFRDGRPNSYVE